MILRSVVVDDFASIYYDFDAFGVELASAEHISEILERLHARIGRRVEPGDRPIIAYFAGRSLLFSAGAPFGRVSARHQPSFVIGGPKGVSINNVVLTDLNFDPPVIFDQAIDNLQSVLRFLELIAGRRRNLLHVEIEFGLGSPASVLKVYTSSPPNRPTAASERNPQPADLPLNGSMEPTEFATVMERWLAVDRERGDARRQFSDGFAEGNLYDTTRLVSSANMFDILPASAVPRKMELSEDLEKAKTKARRIFRSLPAIRRAGQLLGGYRSRWESELKIQGAPPRSDRFGSRCGAFPRPHPGLRTSN